MGAGSLDRASCMKVRDKEVLDNTDLTKQHSLPGSSGWRNCPSKWPYAVEVVRDVVLQPLSNQRGQVSQPCDKWLQASPMQLCCHVDLLRVYLQNSGQCRYRKRATTRARHTVQHQGSKPGAFISSGGKENDAQLVCSSTVRTQ